MLPRRFLLLVTPLLLASCSDDDANPATTVSTVDAGAEATVPGGDAALRSDGAGPDDGSAADAPAADAVTDVPLLDGAVLDAPGDAPYGLDGAPPPLSGPFYFWVDAECKGSLTQDTDPLPDGAYTAVTREARYMVVFAPDGSTASIGSLVDDGGGYLATLESADASVSHYALTTAFAGGRFVVRPTANALPAELVIYGSGLPIVGCERGELLGLP